MSAVTLESLGFNMVPQEPSKNFIKQKFILIGAGKSGKTKFLSCAGDKSFWFRTEAGHNHVKTIGADIHDLKEFEMWKSKLFQAKNAGIFPFELIVVDTGDRLIDFISEDIIEKARAKFTKMDINGIGDIPEGQGWYSLKTTTNLILKQFEDLPCAVALIFHVGTDTLNEEGDTKKTYKKETINIGGKAGIALLAWADHILHIRTGFVGDMQARKLVLRGSKTVEAGSRIKDFPASMPWTEDDSKNYQNFRALFT